MKKAPLCQFVVVFLVFLQFVSVEVAGQVSARQLVFSSTGKYGPEFKDVEQAVKEFKNRNFDLARGLLNRAKKQHENLAPVDTMMAILYLSVGDVGAARKAIDQAIIRAPEDAEAFTLLGDLWLRQKELTVAELAYQRSLDLIEKSKLPTIRKVRLQKQAFAGLASIGEGRGQYSAALDHLKKWQLLDPKNPTCLGSLGRVSFYAQQYDQAREYFKQLNEIEKSAPSSEIAMAGLYADMGMPEKARAEFLKAIEKNANDIRVRINVAEWAINAGEYEMAGENIAAAMKLDPKSATAQLLSARLARQKNDVDGAESILNQAILKYPNHFSISNELARTLSSHSDPSKVRTGLDYARRNFQLYGKQNTRIGTEALFTFAWLLYQNGKTESAAAALNGLAGGTAIGNENAYYAAVIYLKLSKKQVALNALEAALKSKDFFPNRDRAEELLKKLQKETPDKKSSPAKNKQESR